MEVARSTPCVADAAAAAAGDDATTAAVPVDSATG